MFLTALKGRDKIACGIATEERSEFIHSSPVRAQ
jgi:hypothetical protein